MFGKTGCEYRIDKPFWRRRRHMDTIADANQADEDEKLFLEDILRDLRAAVDRLGEQEAQVIRAYYLTSSPQTLRIRI